MTAIEEATYAAGALVAFTSLVQWLIAAATSAGRVRALVIPSLLTFAFGLVLINTSYLIGRAGLGGPKDININFSMVWYLAGGACWLVNGLVILHRFLNPPLR